jgi:uncharacterized Fe-S cluster-containing radical SAM superfamily enzyme
MDALSLPPPLTRFVQIEPVGQCSLRCRVCTVQFRPDGQSGPPAFMALDTFRSLLDQFEGVNEMHLQGLGEPLLHPWNGPAYRDFRERLASPDPPSVCAGCAIYRGTF